MPTNAANKSTSKVIPYIIAISANGLRSKYSDIPPNVLIVNTKSVGKAIANNKTIIAGKIKNLSFIISFVLCLLSGGSYFVLFSDAKIALLFHSTKLFISYFSKKIDYKQKSKIINKKRGK